MEINNGESRTIRFNHGAATRTVTTTDPVYAEDILDNADIKAALGVAGNTELRDLEGNRASGVLTKDAYMFVNVGSVKG